MGVGVVDAHVVTSNSCSPSLSRSRMGPRDAKRAGGGPAGHHPAARPRAVGRRGQRPATARVVRSQGSSVERKRHVAETQATESALNACPSSRPTAAWTPRSRGRLDREYTQRLRVLRADGERCDHSTSVRQDHQDVGLRLAAIAHERATVVGPRDERRLDDTVLRKVQTGLDIEEVRPARRELTDGSLHDRISVVLLPRGPASVPRGRPHRPPGHPRWRTPACRSGTRCRSGRAEGTRSRARRR